MMRYPIAFVQYLVHFHAERDYFECHEVMEEYWKSVPNDPLGPVYVGFIQLAVSMYHHRRGNYKGALKMLRSAERNLTESGVKQLGVDYEGLHAAITDRLHALDAGEPVFEDINIPFADKELLAHCLDVCGKQTLQWNKPHDPADAFLHNKHTLRDRSEVVEERRRQAGIRQKEREQQ
jgi:predicted metal-dependent hydrolase